MLVFVLHVFTWLLIALEVWLALPILYLSIVSISALFQARRSVMHYPPDALHSFQAASFAILIPAHNEEVILGTLLDNLSQLDYPKEHYTVCVIADNCTDRTAELARATSWVKVYERFDEVKRGKGYALNWMWQTLEEQQLIFDAYIILDADSVVVPTFLHSMNRELARGARAMQACNTVLNTTDSPSTALRWLALTLMNHVRPLGRNGLGASSTLTGNGMCLSRSLLLQYPWQAYTLSEDYQYYLSIVEHGEKVRYVPDAVVRSEMPTTFAQMRTQDIRWESSDGNQKEWQVALRLLRAGMKRRDFVCLEAIGELLVPPLSYMVGWSVLLAGVSLAVVSLTAMTMSLVLLAGLVLYVGTAFYLLRPPRSLYGALLHAPRFMLWKLWVYLVLRRSKKHTREWIRTSRVVQR